MTFKSNKQKKNFKIIFFGSESAGLRSLKFLLKQSNLKLLAIITDKKGISAKAFRKIAQENKIPCIDKIDLIKKIRKSDLINFTCILLIS